MLPGGGEGAGTNVDIGTSTDRERIMVTKRQTQMSSSGGAGRASGANCHDSDHGKEKLVTKDCCALCVCCFMPLGLIFAGLFVGVFVGVETTFRERWVFSPGDSRLLFLSSFFCQSGTLKLPSSSMVAQLYSVNGKALSLNTKNNFTIPLNLSVAPGGYPFWNYYLHPNSNLTISAQANLGIDVYIVKGFRGLYGSSPTPMPGVGVETYIVGPFTPDIAFQVNEADDYYIYFNNRLRSSHILVTGSLYFERSEYSPPLDLEQNCSVSQQEQCTIGIPYSTGVQQFLVLTSIPENVDYNEKIELKLSCGQRGWAYAVVVIIPIIATILVIVGTAIVCYWCCNCNCKRSESRSEDQLTLEKMSKLSDVSRSEDQL